MQANVLFIYYIPSGGMETLNRMRYLALKEKGIQASFLYHQEGTGLQNTFDAPLYIAKNDEEMKHIIMSGNYKAIIVASDPRNLQKIRQFGYKHVLIYDIQGLGNNREFAKEYLRTHAYPYVIDFADAIHSPHTPHLIEAVQEIYPEKKYIYFHNCIDTNIVSYQKHQQLNHPIIGWVGRIEENKNWKDFLLIASMLKRKVPNLNVWMFEDNTLSNNEQRKLFEKMIDSLQLRDCLTIFANQPYMKMPLYYSMIGDSGGFLCSTSKVEGFGYAVLEALSCRCPVLATDSDGVRSFIIHNETGKFFDFGKLRQAVSEGIELMKNAPLRNKLRENGTNHAQLHFSLTKYGENFDKMLKQLQAY